MKKIQTSSGALIYTYTQKEEKEAVRTKTINSLLIELTNAVTLLLSDVNSPEAGKLIENLNQLKQGLR